MTFGQDKADRSNVFDSADFKNFLQHNIMRTNDSKSGILDSRDLSLFKSKDSFVSSFMSKDWETKPYIRKRSNSGDERVFFKAPGNDSHESKNVVSSANIPIQKDSKNAIPKSQDWLKLNTLGKHVEIPYSMGIFSSAANSRSQNLGSSSVSSSVSSSLPTKTDVDVQEKQFLSPSDSIIAPIVQGAKKKAPTVQGTKKKRKRAPRKKIIPLNKKYLEPTEKDVLMGRGGKSNHHRGNMRYRAEIERLQEQYKKTDDKDEKTKISERLVSDVQSWGGNFLEKDDKGWYIIDDVVARRKVSQALREDKDPEKRRAKRQRFLAKKARNEKNS